jgi:hypothetical protein
LVSQAQLPEDGFSFLLRSGVTIAIFQPQPSELLRSHNLSGRRLLCLLLKPRRNDDQHAGLIEEQNSENPVELLHSQLKYVGSEFLYEFALHAVSVDTETVDEGVDSGGSFVIQGIDELTSGQTAIRQLDVLDREVSAHADYDYRIIAIAGQSR